MKNNYLVRQNTEILTDIVIEKIKITLPGRIFFLKKKLVQQIKSLGIIICKGFSKISHFYLAVFLKFDFSYMSLAISKRDKIIVMF